MSSTVELRSPAGRSGRGPDTDRGLFARLGRTVTAHPVKIAIGWLLIVAALIMISAALGQPTPSAATAATAATASELPAGYESARAQAVIDKAFGAPSSNATAFLVMSRTDGQPLSASDRALAGHVADGLTRLEATHTGSAEQGTPASVPVSWASAPRLALRSCCSSTSLAMTGWTSSCPWSCTCSWPASAPTTTS